MARKKASKTSSSVTPRRPLVLSGAIALLVVGVLLVILSQSQSSALTDVAAPSVGSSAAGSAASAPARVERIQPKAYLDQFSGQPHLLLDVRTPEEFASGHIPGAVNISLQTLESRLSELPTDQPIVIYCRSGNRSATAANILLRRGFAPLYDLGGILTWQAQGLPVQ